LNTEEIQKNIKNIKKIDNAIELEKFKKKLELEKFTNLKKKT